MKPSWNKINLRIGFMVLCTIIIAYLNDAYSLFSSAPITVRLIHYSTFIICFIFLIYLLILFIFHKDKGDDSNGK